MSENIKTDRDIEPRMVKVLRKFSSHEEMRVQQLRDCQRLTTDEINNYAWRMVIEYREMHDIEPYEPRLQRHISSLRKV